MRSVSIGVAMALGMLTGTACATAVTKASDPAAAAIADTNEGPGQRVTDPRTAPSPPGDRLDPGVTDAAPAAVPEALAFQARRLGGGTVTGADYVGHDVVLWMWAPWCPQCNREAPHVVEAIDTWGDQITFIGLPGGDTDEAHEAFVNKHGLQGMVQAVDDDGSLWGRYGIAYQPAWVFINSDGSAEVVAGGLYDDLEAHLQALTER